MIEDQILNFRQYYKLIKDKGGFKKFDMARPIFEIVPLTEADINLKNGVKTDLKDRNDSSTFDSSGNKRYNPTFESIRSILAGQSQRRPQLEGFSTSVVRASTVSASAAATSLAEALDGPITDGPITAAVNSAVVPPKDVCDENPEAYGWYDPSPRPKQPILLFHLTPYFFPIRFFFHSIFFVV